MRKIISILLIVIGLIIFINPIYKLTSEKLKQKTVLLKPQSLISKIKTKDTINKEKIKDFKAKSRQIFGIL